MFCQLKLSLVVVVVVVRCLETLILGQLSKIRTTLHSIRELDKATDSAHQRLSTLNLNEEVSPLFLVRYPAQSMSVSIFYTLLIDSSLSPSFSGDYGRVEAIIALGVARRRKAHYGAVSQDATSSIYIGIPKQ